MAAWALPNQAPASLVLALESRRGKADSGSSREAEGMMRPVRAFIMA